MENDKQESENPVIQTPEKHSGEQEKPSDFYKVVQSKRKIKTLNRYRGST